MTALALVGAGLVLVGAVIAYLVHVSRDAGRQAERLEQSGAALNDVRLSNEVDRNIAGESDATVRERLRQDDSA